MPCNQLSARPVSCHEWNIRQNLLTETFYVHLNFCVVFSSIRRVKVKKGRPSETSEFLDVHCHFVFTSLICMYMIIISGDNQI
jgi:hypothetical protein